MANPTQNPTTGQLAADLAAGRTTSRQLTEEALARIEDPKGEGKRAFVKVWKAQALAAADASDVQRKVRPRSLATRRHSRSRSRTCATSQAKRHSRARRRSMKPSRLRQTRPSWPDCGLPAP